MWKWKYVFIIQYVFYQIKEALFILPFGLWFFGGESISSLLILWSEWVRKTHLPRENTALKEGDRSPWKQKGLTQKSLVAYGYHSLKRVLKKLILYSNTILNTLHTRNHSLSWPKVAWVEASLSFSFSLQSFVLSKGSRRVRPCSNAYAVPLSPHVPFSTKSSLTDSKPTSASPAQHWSQSIQPGKPVILP